MPDHTYKFDVEVAGTPVPESVATLMTTAVVDDSQNIPDLFVLTYRDPDRTVLKTAGFEIGKAIKISVVAAAHGGGELLMTGEITALEVEYDSDGTLTVVRGLDHSHRLFRGMVNVTYLNVTASDVVRKVAQRAGMTVGTVDPTTPVFDYLCQANETDWAFLRRLAADNDMTVGVAEGKLNFRSTKPAASGPKAGALQTSAPDPFQLVVGENVSHIRCSITSAEQVKEVEVRSFDPRQHAELVARAPAKTSAAKNGVTPAGLAAKFGNASYVITSRPVRLQKEADQLAKATAEQFAGASAEITGTAVGNAKLAAGTPISLGLAGAPFDGQYLLTSTRHRYDQDTGYTTEFTVSGKQERSLLGLAGGGGSTPDTRAQGLAYGIVTDVRDPDKVGRVRVKFPHLADHFETHWAPVVYPGAAKDRGFMLIPEVNDVVMVAFEHGDMARPVVLGGVYSTKAKPPQVFHHAKPATEVPYADARAGRVDNRVWVSRLGHKLVFQEKSGAESITLSSKDEKNKLLIDISEKTVTILADRNVVVEAGKDVTVKAKANVSVEAKQNVSIKATGTLELEGTNVKITAKGPLEAAGKPIKLN